MERARIAEFLLGVSLFGAKRSPKNINDFGDDATIGLNLKKAQRGHGVEDFGRYLGKLKNGKWGVGVKDVLYWRRKR